jgi:hypothetical protein
MKDELIAWLELEAQELDISGYGPKASGVNAAAKFVVEFLDGCVITKLVEKGESMPQTVEACQVIMQRDAEAMLEIKSIVDSQDKEIKKLWKMTARGAGGGWLDPYSQGYDKAMVRMRVAIADVIKLRQKES